MEKVNPAKFTKKRCQFESICIIYEIFVKIGIFRLIFQKVWHTIGTQPNQTIYAAFLKDIEVKNVAERGARGA